MFKTVLATQFCIPDLDPLAYRSNVHLAPGYLVGYAQPLFPEIDFIITPRIYTDVLSDDAFIDYALQVQPDLMVFSLYMWNIERSLEVAKTIKKRLPHVSFLFGGPEVTPDNSLLLNSDIYEIGIVGEGEIAFVEFLSGTPKDVIPGCLTKNTFNHNYKLRTTFAPETNPYANGLMEIIPDRTLFIETVRGCPFRCRFCTYNKMYDSIIQTDTPLSHIFNIATEGDFDEIFFLDPSFNVQPNFDVLLTTLSKLNADQQFNIATELRADLLTDQQIQQLVDLNLIEAEIGLQTTNPAALKQMNRPNKTDKTIENTKKMIAAGIDCKVDLIAGLPGDTLNDFKQSVDDVIKAGIQDHVQVFRLSILPGTEFSTEREKYGITADPKPPYAVQSVSGFDSDDILEALIYAEEMFESSATLIPSFLLSTDFSDLTENCVQFNTDIEPIHKLIIEQPIDLEPIKHRLARSLVLHFIINDTVEQLSTILTTLDFFKQPYRPDHLQIVLEFNTEVSPSFILNIAAQLPYTESYLDRDAAVHLGEGTTVSTRFALIFSEQMKDHPTYHQLSTDFDTFLKISAQSVNDIEKLLENHNLFICGAHQLAILKHLDQTDQLDDFTIFDNYRIESLKSAKQYGTYLPGIIKQ